ncbi:hypothetical protein [Algoriphagus antarcticus]|uniref:hypothetical protein n=1 Tax=Algoriphagus antarcticus TaxID=238540 RepID=UPI000A3D43D4|nr:hypothetical protein [Algoriphagus antarcticus]
MNQLHEIGEECCTKDGSPLAMIKRKPKPSELSWGIIINNKGTGLPQTTFRACPALREVVCKPPYAALGGNSLGGER